MRAAGTGGRKINCICYPDNMVIHGDGGSKQERFRRYHKTGRQNNLIRQKINNKITELTRIGDNEMMN